MKILLPVFFICALLVSSCQSEYDIQLIHAHELVRQEANFKNVLLSNDRLDENGIAMLRNIRNEIEFSAHLSGNKRLFLEEVQHFRIETAREQQQPTQFITKFP